MPPLLDPPLLTPARVLGWLRLEHHGASMRAGRNVVIARGWPRHRAESAPRMYQELEFDAEHGTMVRSATFVNGCCVQCSEATMIKYACAVDPTHFVYTSPPGLAR